MEIRENFFAGAGDEFLDLGGDVLVDGNVFQHITKDPKMGNGVYANAISTGDPGNPAATVVCTRNIFWDLDHAISCRVGTATIFEHNTVAKIHPDFTDVGGRLNTGSAISLRAVAFSDAPGDGCYLAGNLFSDLPRVIGNADSPASKVSKIEATLNFVDPAASLAIGQREADLFGLGPFNQTGDAGFVHAASGDLHLAADSPARSKGVLGRDAGAYVPTGAWVDVERQGDATATDQTITVGGPGIFAYRWRMRAEAAWSAAVPIGEPIFSRSNPTVRTTTLSLSGLLPGTHQVEVIGQDFAGQWQDEAAPTRSVEWTVRTLPSRFEDLKIDPEGDTDGDGISHLLEYALGLSLTESDSANVEAALGVAGGLEVTFSISSPASEPEFVGRPDISFSIQTSADLESWTAIGQIHLGNLAAPGIIAGPILNDRRVIRVTAPSMPGGRQFVVVRAVWVPTP